MLGLGQELVKVGRRLFHALFPHGSIVPILTSAFPRKLGTHSACHSGTAWYVRWRNVGCGTRGSWNNLLSVST